MAEIDFEALKVYQKQVELVDRVWWYFVTFTVAVVGFTIGDGMEGKRLGMVCISYILAAAGSGVPLWYGQRQLGVFARLVPGVTLKPFTPKEAVLFLGGVVVVALAVIMGAAWPLTGS